MRLCSKAPTRRRDVLGIRRRCIGSAAGYHRSSLLRRYADQRERAMISTSPVSPSTGIAGQTTSTRVLSIDIFRGITMAVMIFVNDLDSVHGLSKWTYHMPSNVDAMTYVDMVFPAFLFIVGMALPIAVKQRLRRNPSIALLWLHVVLRAAGLLVLGLILANADQGDAVRMHISPDAWAILSLVGAVL